MKVIGDEERQKKREPILEVGIRLDKAEWLSNRLAVRPEG
jgi:hypothetical protein